MSSEPFPYWIFVAGGAMVVLLLAAVKILHRVREGRAPQELPAFLHSERKEGISLERAALITDDAQSAAWQVTLGHQAMSLNPHPPRTREYVLWEASFHSAMSDLAELAERTQQADTNMGAPR